MAEGHTGLRKEDLQDWAPWTKLFTSFKVALDPKKLLLAAAGILVMAAGWWFLALIFYLPYQGGPPQWENYWKDYEKTYKDRYSSEDVAKRKAWADFKRNLNSWNLMHKLAGPVPDINTKEGRAGAQLYKFTAADFATSAGDYEDITREIENIEAETEKRRQKVKVEVREDGKSWLKIGKHIIDFEPVGSKAKDVKKALDNDITAQKLLDNYNANTNIIKIKQHELKVTEPDTWKKFAADVATSPSLADIEKRVQNLQTQDPEKAHDLRMALNVLQMQDQNRYKPAAYLATWPWFEDRGENPFLLIAGLNPEQIEKERRWPWQEGRFFEWLLTKQTPVLLEPLFKFLSPLVYLFHPNGSFWIRIYLLLVVLWTIATWSFFGGAITRMASVQVARPHDNSVGLKEAMRFAGKRYFSYFTAQLFPLGALALLTLLLIIFGLIEVVTFFLGDIIVAGLGMPIALLFGLIMAVLLVGLVGWPMMHTTISTEGSDNFDAISRSYSYVYQKPWGYLWYGVVAIFYGAVLVFFIGLMGSLTVYLGKWGMSLGGSGDWWGREPSYLFMYAPTSFGWRDLLLAQSPHAIPTEVVQNSGTLDTVYRLRADYSSSLAPWNYIGAFLVAVWVWLLFLLVLGFAYSYFWTASTIIYLLMRKKIDDTDYDEIYLEEDEMEAPYMPTTYGGQPPPPSSGTVPLQTLDTSKMRTPSAPASSPPNESAGTTPPSAPPEKSTDGEGDKIGTSAETEQEGAAAETKEPEPSQPEEEKGTASTDGEDGEKSEKEDTEKSSGGG